MKQLLALALVAVWACAAMSAGAAGDQPDPAVRAYVLEIDKIRQYVAAVHSLEAAAHSDKTVEAELDKMSDEPDTTIDEARTKFARHPRIFGFYRSKGLSIDDAVLLPLATLNAIQASESDATPDTLAAASPDQIAFAKEHRDELTSMMDWGEGQD